MRLRVLGTAVVLAGLMAGSGIVSGGGAQAGSGPIITDPAGDATDVVVATGAPSTVSEPSLDIVSADIAVGNEAVTTTVKVVQLGTLPPPGSSGSYFRWYFTYGGIEFYTRSARGADGTAAFALYDSAGKVDCAGCTGSFDPASNTVTAVVPLAVVNADIAKLSTGKTPPIGDGAVLSGLEVLAQRQVSAPTGQGVTPTADTASADRVYRVGPAPAPRGPVSGVDPDEKGDAVVVAVVDFNMAPYHWDFDAAHMPQHLDGDPANDLPLDTPPDQWLPGFPAPSQFASYQALPLTMASDDASAEVEALAEKDAAVWESVPRSSEGAINYRWVPGTKVIGAVDFGGSTMRGSTSDHGVGVTSVSVGNLHGTCPECLLVFVNIASNDLTSTDQTDAAMVEAAVRWATSQPWIDVVTDSWGLNMVGGYVRDNVHLGRGTVDATRAASDRGQTVFFSAGNGLENAFVVPNTTYLSALKGPDWIMTVGAVTPPPAVADFSGAGKPVDLSGIGISYPSAYESVHVDGTGAGGFSGTSNATPTVAGMYARGLYAARAALPGPSRVQQDGVIAAASGPGAGSFACGSVRADCELGDGVLTAGELRTRLLEGAVPGAGAWSVGGLADTDPMGEDARIASEGHGAYTGRVTGFDSVWDGEFERLFGPLVGRAAVPERPAGERAWMTVDSFCRQHLWGAWGGGYYRSADFGGGPTPLPGVDPAAWPLRSALEAGCPGLTVP